mmetsp:Transcript_85281/g.236288  ORF Transcript_85281/g.236288 Transcript_85281/m.236288 type:complete len:248 (+) Transcript_85281:109-852(+)
MPIPAPARCPGAPCSLEDHARRPSLVELGSFLLSSHSSSSSSSSSSSDRSSTLSSSMRILDNLSAVASSSLVTSRKAPGRHPLQSCRLSIRLSMRRARSWCATSVCTGSSCRLFRDTLCPRLFKSSRGSDLITCSASFALRWKILRSGSMPCREIPSRDMVALRKSMRNPARTRASSNNSAPFSRTAPTSSSDFWARSQGRIWPASSFHFVLYSSTADFASWFLKRCLLDRDSFVIGLRRPEVCEAK